MYLQLEESDRIVVEYNGPETGECITCGHEKDFFLHNDEHEEWHQYTSQQNHIVLAASAESADTDIYVVLWKLRHMSDKFNNKWQIMWRGNWTTSMKAFSELVGDVDADAMLELQKGASA